MCTTKIDQAINCYNEIEQTQNFGQWLRNEVEAEQVEFTEDEIIDAIGIFAFSMVYPSFEFAKEDAKIVTKYEEGDLMTSNMNDDGITCFINKSKMINGSCGKNVTEFNVLIKC